MDDLVKAAMAKWPNVPDCYGWLALDARGRWWMRDDQAQAAGPFAGPGASTASRGSLLRHEKLIDFIGRNYAQDDRGCAYFQNGPQRVFVELELAPWVWRVGGDGSVSTHTGERTTVQDAWLDEQGHLYLVGLQGLGVVHSQDMWLALAQVESGAWKPGAAQAVELQRRYHVVLSPQELPTKKNPAMPG